MRVFLAKSVVVIKRRTCVFFVSAVFSVSLFLCGSLYKEKDKEKYFRIVQCFYLCTQEKGVLTNNALLVLIYTKKNLTRGVKRYL